MRKPESTYRSSIVKLLKGSGIYTWGIHDSYTSGVPDHYYSGSGGSMFAEYKYLPKDTLKFDLTRPPKSPKLSRLQQEWLNSRHHEGRHVCVIVGMPSGGVILVDGAWMTPVFADRILTRKEIAAYIMEICLSETGPRF